MQSELSSRPLGDLVEPDTPITYGVVKPGPEDSEGVLFVRGGDIADGRILVSQLRTITKEVSAQYSRTLLRGHELVVSLVGNPGQVALVPASLRGANIARQVGLVRLAHGVDPRFVKYFLGSPAGQEALGAQSRGSVQQVINLRDLRTVRVPLPPYRTQQGIADVFSCIDDRIDLLRQTSATLESIAQALFKSWFIDFDPVRAKAEGREPEGMDAATAALFPAEFEESALGLIPKGWTAGSLGNICELTKGCSYKGDGLSEDEGAYMFNLGCFNSQRVFATEKVKRYTGEYRPRHLVQPNDLIIANTDMTQARDILGRPVFVPGGFEPGFVSHHVFKVTVTAFEGHGADALRRFLFFTFREPAFRERAIGFATGTTVLALPATAVLDCPACIPEAPVLAAWNEVVRHLFSAIRDNEARAESLAELRDSLLPRLISGKLRLPAAQEQVEDALA